MFRWMCDAKENEFQVELRQRLGIDDIILVLQQNKLQRYGHVLQKEDNDWMKKCMEFEVGGYQTKRWTKEDLERGCAKRLSCT